MSTGVSIGFVIERMTAVLAPGAGETMPVMRMGVAPEYEAALVWTATVGPAAAKTGMEMLPTTNRTSANRGALRSAFLKDKILARR